MLGHSLWGPSAAADNTVMVRCSMRPWAFVSSSCQRRRGKNRRCERRLDIVEKVFLVAFDRQNLVAAACHYGFGDALLAKHGIGRHHFVGQIDAPQQRQRIGNSLPLPREAV
jgi:hypothetical protein